MNLTAMLSVLAAFIGFVGVFALHNDLHDVAHYTLMPLVNKVDKFTLEVRPGETSLHLFTHICPHKAIVSWFYAEK